MGLDTTSRLFLDCSGLGLAFGLHCIAEQALYYPSHLSPILTSRGSLDLSFKPFVPTLSRPPHTRPSPCSPLGPQLNQQTPLSNPQHLIYVSAYKFASCKSQPLIYYLGSRILSSATTPFLPPFYYKTDPL